MKGSPLQVLFTEESHTSLFELSQTGEEISRAHVSAYVSSRHVKSGKLRMLKLVP
jgi:hypothetical protein